MSKSPKNDSRFCAIAQSFWDDSTPKNTQKPTDSKCFAAEFHSKICAVFAWNFCTSAFWWFLTDKKSASFTQASIWSCSLFCLYGLLGRAFAAKDQPRRPSPRTTFPGLLTAKFSEKDEIMVEIFCRFWYARQWGNKTRLQTVKTVCFLGVKWMNFTYQKPAPLSRLRARTPPNYRR